MALKHVNRRGDTYYLQARTTKTGKPKYYFGRQLSGAPVEDLPEGYEIHERMNDDQVFLRRARPTPLRKADRDMLAAAIRKHAGRLRFLIGIEGEHLVIYLSDVSGQSANPVFRSQGNVLTRPDPADRGSFIRMMRFTLVDEDERLFSVGRWCFLGSIDTWMPLAGPAPLDDHANTYLPHLGRESFFELEGLASDL